MDDAIVMIDELNLSARTKNCLKRRGIRTKEQLMLLDDGELMRIRGFGAGCLKEIREKLGEPVKVARKKTETITLAQAFNLVAEEYEKAQKLDYIRNPIAYALHRVWKIADAEVADV